MSSFSSTATATCTLSGLGTINEVLLSAREHFASSPELIPDDFCDLDFETFSDQIELYVNFRGETLTLQYDTEQDNDSQPFFEALIEHYRTLQSSPYMLLTWLLDDSREGISTGVRYYDVSGNEIDVDTAIRNHLAA